MKDKEARKAIQSLCKKLGFGYDEDQVFRGIVISEDTYNGARPSKQPVPRGDFNEMVVEMAKDVRKIMDVLDIEAIDVPAQPEERIFRIRKTKSKK